MGILVTGGAGFIGCNFVRQWLSEVGESIINLDKLTYAGRLENFAEESSHANYQFVHGDMGDSQLVESLLAKSRPSAIVNFAAESHVDRSLQGGDDFIDTNIVATYNFLKSVYNYWLSLSKSEQHDFRFLHISTDEVYGSLDFDSPAFCETNQHAPSSLYSASKAASDHLVHAYFKTYGLPVIVTHSSNNYGPHQFPEKLIPLMIIKALSGEPLPIYGDGKNIRDWIHVSDNCQALMQILNHGIVGESYNIGSQNEVNNLKLVEMICDLLDQLQPLNNKTYHSQISFVTDRLGHDRRYALNTDKIQNTINWQPQYTLQEGLKTTLQWYLNNAQWIKAVSGDDYQNWLNNHYQNHSAN